MTNGRFISVIEQSSGRYRSLEVCTVTLVAERREKKITGSTAVPFFLPVHGRPRSIQPLAELATKISDILEPRPRSRSMNAFSSPRLLIAEGYFCERSITAASMHVVEYNWPHCRGERTGHATSGWCITVSSIKPSFKRIPGIL